MKAIICAAGRGRRMGNLIKKIPKSLLNYKEGDWHGGYIILAYVPISLVVSFIIISGGRV